jgi:hypothetical protein
MRDQPSRNNENVTPFKILHFEKWLAGTGKTNCKEITIVSLATFEKVEKVNPPKSF